MGKKYVDEKLSLTEYQDKYMKRQTVKNPLLILRLLAVGLGVIVFKCLFDLCYQAYAVNKYFGLAVAIISVVLFVVFYVLPAVKISKTEYFQTNVNSRNLKEAKKKNKNLRSKLATNIIDCYNNVENFNWYNEQRVETLALAVESKNNDGIKATLNEIYDKDVKAVGKDMIMKNSLQSGLCSAISQSESLDVFLVISINLKMIKDLVFLYGFRPSEAKLLNIFKTVIRNALASYGVNKVNPGNMVAGALQGVVKGVPLLGDVIATLVDSTVQGLSNAVLTYVLGVKTIKYVCEEYKLQNILDNVEVLNVDEDLSGVTKELEIELKKASLKTKKAV